MSALDPLLGGAQERAEHALTLRRTLRALGWAGLVGLVLVVGTVAATNRSLAGVGPVLGIWIVWFAVGAVVATLPVTVGALWALRRLPAGRWPRILVGGFAGLVFGLVSELLAVGASPWVLVRDEPGIGAMLLLWPAVAGAVAGWIVGPRPVAVAPGPGPDERAEDALLDGTD